MRASTTSLQYSNTQHDTKTPNVPQSTDTALPRMSQWSAASEHVSGSHGIFGVVSAASSRSGDSANVAYLGCRVWTGRGFSGAPAAVWSHQRVSWSSAPSAQAAKGRDWCWFSHKEFQERRHAGSDASSCRVGNCHPWPDAGPHTSTGDDAVVLDAPASHRHFTAGPTRL